MRHYRYIQPHSPSLPPHPRALTPSLELLGTAVMINPTINPNNPKILLNTSTIKILNKQLRISRVRHGGITTRDAHRNTAAQVAHAYRQPAPEEYVTG